MSQNHDQNARFVLAFCQTMLHEMNENEEAGKEGWQDMNAYDLVSEILDHAAKLSKVLQVAASNNVAPPNNDWDEWQSRIRELGADLANMAKFASAIYGGLVAHAEETSKQTPSAQELLIEAEQALSNAQRLRWLQQHDPDRNVQLLMGMEKMADDSVAATLDKIQTFLNGRMHEQKLSWIATRIHGNHRRVDTKTEDLQ